MEGLVLQSITSGYKDKSVLKDFSLSVQPGETLVVMGVSGAGKTTLLNTILGVIKPTQGTITVNGKDITNLPIEERGIGYLSQFYGLFPHLNVKNNIAYGLRIQGCPKDEQDAMVKKMLEVVDLKDFENRNVQELSGGQQQRIALARSLAVKPSLILLDEPLSNIDQVTKLDVAKDLKKLFDSLSIPVVLVTHQWEDAHFLGKRIAILIDGKIEQSGTFDEITKSPKSPFIKRLLQPYSEVEGALQSH